MKQAIDPKRIDELLATGKAQVSNILSALGKLQPYIDVLYTEIGRQLLEETIERGNKLYSKFLSEGLSEEEQVELRVISRQLGSWARRIDHFNKGIAELNKMG